MRQQRNQDSSSVYRTKDSPTQTPDGQAHVQFANPEVTYKTASSNLNQRNLSSPNATHHSPKSIISNQQSQIGNGTSKIASDSVTNSLSYNGNQTYHTSETTSAVHPSSYENMPKIGDTHSPAKDYGAYVKPSSPSKNNGNLLSPTASKMKSTPTSASKVTR